MSLTVPTSTAAAAAGEVPRTSSSPALVNHGVRAYLYAVVDQTQRKPHSAAAAAVAGGIAARVAKHPHERA